jgi:hypothetical protein
VRRDLYCDLRWLILVENQTSKVPSNPNINMHTISRITQFGETVFNCTGNAFCISWVIVKSTYMKKKLGHTDVDYFWHLQSHVFET